MDAERRFLFIGGTGRSGTTALVHLLNCHPDVVLGNERFLHRIRDRTATPDLFAPERFAVLLPGDTHGLAQDHFGGVDPARRAAPIRGYVGDKYPRLWEALPFLTSRFPGARFLAILRNPTSVAESYEARFQNPADGWNADFRKAVLDWNAMAAATLAAIRSGATLAVVTYERLFRPGGDVAPLFRALNLDPAALEPRTVELFAQTERVTARRLPRNNEVRLHVALHADFAAYRTLVGEHCILRSQ